MATKTVNETIDFAALWESAEQPDSQAEYKETPMVAKQVPEFLMPQSILIWFEDLADRCLKEGLVDEKQHGLLIRGGREQSAVFSCINPEKLRQILVKVQRE